MAIHFSKAPWGLDFTFSLLAKAFKQMKLRSWRDLLDLAANSHQESLIVKLSTL